MRILFWNTNKNEKIEPYISTLIFEYDIDILVLAELCNSSFILTQELKKNNIRIVRVRLKRPA